MRYSILFSVNLFFGVIKYSRVIRLKLQSEKGNQHIVKYCRSLAIIS